MQIKVVRSVLIPLIVLASGFGSEALAVDFAGARCRDFESMDSSARLAFARGITVGIGLTFGVQDAVTSTLKSHSGGNPIANSAYDKERVLSQSYLSQNDFPGHERFEHDLLSSCSSAPDARIAEIVIGVLTRNSGSTK